nr:putative HTLV-1-related endogenous sequence [Meriones unguiculatus]
MAAANSNTRLVATAAAALRPRRPRPPALQTRALTAHSTGRRRRRAQAAARPSEGGDTEGAERRDPARARRRTVRAAPEAPGTGPGPRGSPWRPPPRASGRLLPAGCDRRAPELRVAAWVSRGPRAPRWLAMCTPAPRRADGPERSPLRPWRRKTTGTRPPAIGSVGRRGGLPQAPRGCSRNAPAAPAPELRSWAGTDRITTWHPLC